MSSRSDRYTDQTHRDEDDLADYGDGPHVDRVGADGPDAAEDGGILRLWDESLITLLIVGGAVLFVIPEPATSGLGVLLVTLGVVAWAIDWVA